MKKFSRLKKIFILNTVYKIKQCERNKTENNKRILNLTYQIK